MLLIYCSAKVTWAQNVSYKHSALLIGNCIAPSSSEKLPAAVEGKDCRDPQPDSEQNERDTLKHPGLQGMPTSNPFLWDSQNPAKEEIGVQEPQKGGHQEKKVCSLSNQAFPLVCPQGPRRTHRQQPPDEHSHYGHHECALSPCSLPTVPSFCFPSMVASPPVQ